MTALRRELRLVLARRGAVALLVVGAMLCAFDAARPTNAAPTGVLGAIVLTSDSNYTYGLALCLGIGLLVGMSYQVLSDVWHTAGVSRPHLVCKVLVASALSALLSRLVVVGAIASGGLVDGVRRGLQWNASTPGLTDGFVKTQARDLGAYVLVAVMGGLVAVAARRRIPAVVLASAIVVPYLPVVGALTNRAPRILDSYPYGPFGALRGALTTNGGILGDDPAHFRTITALAAGVVLFAWLALGFLVSAIPTGAVTLRPSLPLIGRCVAGVATAALIGAIVPKAVGGSVPWQWQPNWRHATSQGWDSRQVAAKWIAAERSGVGSARYVAPPYRQDDVPPSALSAIEGSTATRIEPISRMRGPYRVRALLLVNPPRQSGANLLVDAAEIQLTMAFVDGRWLVRSVGEAAIHIVVDQ
jgi:hypothetical protein